MSYEQLRRIYVARVEADIEMMFDLLSHFANGRADRALDHLLACMDNSDTLGPDTTAEQWELVARAKAAYPLTERPFDEHTRMWDDEIRGMGLNPDHVREIASRSGPWVEPPAAEPEVCVRCGPPYGYCPHVTDRPVTAGGES